MIVDRELNEKVVINKIREFRLMVDYRINILRCKVFLFEIMS